MEKSSILEMKTFVENISALKVSVKKSGISTSMRGYIVFSAKKKSGIYPEWSNEVKKEILKELAGSEPNPTFVNKYQVCFYVGNELYNYDFKRK